MKKKYKLIIVTVTYKSVNDLPEFINSFYKYNDLGNDARLIVVDNSPKDYREVELIIKLYNDIEYVSLPDNPGFGAANNKGFDLYDSDYVLFINNDVEFLEPVFKKLISIHKQESHLGCIGIHQKGGSPSYFRKIDAPTKTDNSSFIDEYHFISGAFMFFKSRIFFDIGCFDPKLFMFYEEYDLSRRLIANSFYTSYIPSIHFLHKVGNRRRLNESTWLAAIKSFVYICKKYNLNPKVYPNEITLRLYKLRMYFLLVFNFREVFMLTKLIKVRKQIIRTEFNV